MDAIERVIETSTVRSQKFIAWLESLRRQLDKRFAEEIVDDKPVNEEPEA